MIVREFSRAGPCIRLGELVNTTASFYVYRDHNSETHRVKKGRLVHTDPCSSCRDHARTQYPDGYMD